MNLQLSQNSPKKIQLGTKYSKSILSFSSFFFFHLKKFFLHMQILFTTYNISKLHRKKTLKKLFFTIFFFFQQMWGKRIYDYKNFF